jgi:antitoxin component YwqK of YwqJK toxin-antitoxin module
MTTRVDHQELVHDDDGVMFYRGVPYTGVAFDCWPNGVVATETHYKDGIEDGPERSWYSTGVLESDCTHDHGRVRGLLRKWHPNGRLMLEEEIGEGAAVLRKKEWDLEGRLISQYP